MEAVELFVEDPDRRPSHPRLGVGSKVAKNRDFPVDFLNVAGIWKRIDQLQPVSGAFDKRRAMPRLLYRAAGARLIVPAPAGDFEHDAPRRQCRRNHAIFQMMQHARPNSKNIGRLHLAFMRHLKKGPTPTEPPWGCRTGLS